MEPATNFKLKEDSSIRLTLAEKEYFNMLLPSFEERHQSLQGTRFKEILECLESWGIQWMNFYTIAERMKQPRLFKSISRINFYQLRQFNMFDSDVQSFELFGRIDAPVLRGVFILQSRIYQLSSLKKIYFPKLKSFAVNNTKKEYQNSDFSPLTMAHLPELQYLEKDYFTSELFKLESPIVASQSQRDFSLKPKERTELIYEKVYLRKMGYQFEEDVE